MSTILGKLFKWFGYDSKYWVTSCGESHHNSELTHRNPDVQVQLELFDVLITSDKIKFSSGCGCPLQNKPKSYHGKAG